ncbi:TIGR02680 family protein [Desulfotomaculum arcticum]|uniref:TIGR02680 family protein n=1 Tax=Desulfotruncus arcticus DSM 17038 TaxID=1121424 RepID=A0A1I2PHX9_9FIRM|nr:TIGR02680 family protein [Desulfotruncus arcticus]SFG15150.1 TIGR02680 family protein [Desulfotomaculum arcticum] [Desulfotruncus arcticus DSM 17038]
MTERWQMNRAGIINFWYYDEAEFYLAGGRLILRGANGSGKSVTMQSFLPLVLDGDKRPWRLDPFGSKDRRIDYYLLLEPDSGHTDRTGYLYLEFYHPAQDRYLTVGIGLRARRNSPNLGFWGFVITDNRRVGRDIWLYEKDYSQGREVKIPLTRAQLEEAIGSGGQVVTEQGEYKRLVNKVLFGYEKIESFQELLDLLIQLRSPKLSKDFKPSTIYEILTGALPALQEDELRPLSEVLEDMDEINDRLNELAVHLLEAEKLHRSYNKYNEYLLYNASRSLLQQKKQRDDRKREAGERRDKTAGLAAELAEKTGDREEAGTGLERTKTEYQTLLTSEAVEKRTELNRLRTEQGDLNRNRDNCAERLRFWRDKQARAGEEQKSLTGQREELAGRQNDLLLELEDLARDVDFGYHDTYHRRWDGDIPADGSLWPAWERDIREHREKIGRAVKLAREESALKTRRVQAETEASLAREKRAAAEDQTRLEEDKLEQARREQEEKIFHWRRQLSRLSLADEDLHRVMQALALFPDRSYDNVREPVTRAYYTAREAITAERLAWQNQMRQHAEEKDRLTREWQQWRDLREPEPPRSPAREYSRHKRPGAGAPLYALCEFMPELTEEKKAALESTLQQAGLLDAWVSPEGMGVLGADEEETWLKPAPQLLRPTLADYLVPTPPKNSGLTPEIIDDVLRTVCLAGDADMPGWAGKPDEAVITGQGYFRLGALCGKAALKERAEFIGKETRQRTRLAEMAKLEALIEEEEKALAACREQLELLDETAKRLEADLQAFPDGETLQEALRGLEKARLRLDAALEEEQSKNTVLREVIKQLQEAAARLHEHMAGWNIPRTESALEQAAEQMSVYRNNLGELKSFWTEYKSVLAALTRAEKDLAEAGENAGHEEEELAGLQERLRKVQYQIEVYQQLLEELGIADIDRRLHQLEQRQKELERQIDRMDRQITEIKINLAVAEKDTAEAVRQLEQAEAELERQTVGWLVEWNRQLVADWAEVTFDPADSPAVFRAAGQVDQRYRERYGGKTYPELSDQLHDVFHNTRQALHDYAPETVTEAETHRLLVLFTRDRQNPVPPHLLVQELKELAEEQKHLLSQKDRELYEQIILHSVGKAIRDKIYRAEKWVRQMNDLMQQRDTSSGLRLHLKWEPRAAANERELDTAQLVRLLKTDPRQLRDEHIEQMIEHFRSRITRAKLEADQQDTLRQWIFRLLDYRQWFRFTLYYEKGGQPRRELTDARFNVLSGGEKALSMYIPLFAAANSRYNDSRPGAPRIICLDEAFAGVDEENMRDMFELLTHLGFDYMMTSQVLWGCYDTVPGLSIYEVYRPRDVDYVTLIRYYWNGTRRVLVDEQQEDKTEEQVG